MIKEGKLFYWYDRLNGLTEDLVNAFYSFNIIDTIDVGFNYNFQDGFENPKFAVYFFCKDDLTKYKKRIITSELSSLWDYPWYRKLRINCKKKK